MIPLIEKMVQNDPEKRPTMNEVVIMFRDIIQSLSSSKARSRLRELHELEAPMMAFERGLAHAANTAVHVFSFKKAIPTP